MERLLSRWPELSAINSALLDERADRRSEFSQPEGLGEKRIAGHLGHDQLIGTPASAMLARQAGTLSLPVGGRRHLAAPRRRSEGQAARQHNPIGIIAGDLAPKPGGFDNVGHKLTDRGLIFDQQDQFALPPGSVRSSDRRRIVVI